MKRMRKTLPSAASQKPSTFQWWAPSVVSSVPVSEASVKRLRAAGRADGRGDLDEVVAINLGGGLGKGDAGRVCPERGCRERGKHHQDRGKGSWHGSSSQCAKTAANSTIRFAASL